MKKCVFIYTHIRTLSHTYIIYIHMYTHTHAPWSETSRSVSWYSSMMERICRPWGPVGFAGG